MKKFLFGLCAFLSVTAFGQGKSKRVLFLGNSYTYVNDLPKMLADIAAANGDTLIYDSYAPGGHSIGNHSLNSISLGKIMLGKWDFVVLQGQSYELAGTTPEISPFPYARKLDSLINQYSDCVETVLYMTWGRKNGDPTSCPTIPYLCTYEKMDSVIHKNYMWLTDTINAIITPVGAVWRYIRKNHPTIELYQTDESHPSVAGTYAGACAFYTALYRKNPALISYNPGLSVAEAATIRNATKVVVYDSLLHWHIGEYDHVVNPKCMSTSISEQESIVDFSFFPNPVSGVLTINCAASIQNERMQVYNHMGRMITEVECSKSLQLPVQDFPNGLYFIRLKNSTNKAFPFVKN